MRKAPKRFAIAGKIESVHVDSRVVIRSPSLVLPMFASVLLSLLLCAPAVAQGGTFSIYGDLKVDESKVSGLKPISFQVTLQSQRLSTMGRQMVTSNGRFRFENLSSGTYYIVVMMENTEVANVRVLLSGVIGSDVRKDITLEWRPNPVNLRNEKGGVVSATAPYTRSGTNQSFFEKAEESVKRKDYERASSLLQQIVRSDSKDFEAWTELGTIRSKLNDDTDAEKDYLQALKQEPSFVLALINLGKLRLAEKDYQGAIEFLSKAVTLPPHPLRLTIFSARHT